MTGWLVFGAVALWAIGAVSTACAITFHMLRYGREVSLLWVPVWPVLWVLVSIDPCLVPQRASGWPPPVARGHRDYRDMDTSGETIR